MSELMNRLRQQAKSLRDARVPTRTRYSAEFRAQALAVAGEQQSRGWSVSRVARELGLKAKTLSMWQQSAGKTAVRRIVVTPDIPLGVAATAPLVVTAGAVRVEGLDFEGVVRLLRALS